MRICRIVWLPNRKLLTDPLTYCPVYLLLCLISICLFPYFIQVELNITIKSYGSEDPGYGQQPIQINGNNIGTSSRGFNVVVMSHINGQKLGADNFDTYGNSAADDAMVNFIESFPNGSIIVMAATDSAEAKLSQDTRDYISSLGSISINSIQFRSSFALLTSKGTSKPDWFAEKYAAVKNGPSVIEANMRFPSL